MRVLLLQLDGKLPNVALMRISAHHRALGHSVELRQTRTLAAVERNLFDAPDRVYASLIFTRSRPIAERVREVWPGAAIGGTGWDSVTKVEDFGIETKAQDYALYPDFQASIGFTQRGCRLRCEFCVVPVKEGKVQHEQTIAELWRGEPWPRNLLLLDNDFFGQPDWRERIDEIRAGGFRVSFSQGINARMLSEEAAAAIASVDYRDDSFRDRRIYTAWDNRQDEVRLFTGLDALKRHGVKPKQVMVYMLCGYWKTCPKCRRDRTPDLERCPTCLAKLEPETHEDREHRRQRLRAWGARPYPMIYERTPELVAYQRWVLSKSMDLVVPWDQWLRARASVRRAAEHHFMEANQLKIGDV